MKTFDIILKPVITEKATDQEKKGKYSVIVRKDATKIDVKEAFRALYGVKVLKINVMRTASKTRMGRGKNPVMKKHEFKKVIVTLDTKKPLDLTKPTIK